MIFKQARRKNSVLGRHKKFCRGAGGGHKNIFRDEDQKKDLDRKCIPVASVRLLSLGHDFCLGGTKALFAMHFAKNSEVKTKKKKKRCFSQMHPCGVSPVAVF